MNLSYEPVRIAAAVSGLIGAALVLLAAFGFPLTEEQRNAILAFVAAAVPIGVFIAGEIARSKSVPVAKMQDVPGGQATLDKIEAKNEAG